MTGEKPNPPSAGISGDTHRPPGDKPTARGQLRRLLEQVTPETRHARSLAASALLSASPEFESSRVVMIYLSTPHELDTSTIALRCWQNGKLVVAPRVSWDQRRMMPVEINSLGDEQMTVTGPGIREPRDGAPMPIDMIDLVLVPGLGFSPAGHRLGRGMGFYDRFLSQRDFRGATCGLCYEDQVLDALPVQPHDVGVTMLVTDQRLRRFQTVDVKA